MTEFRVWIKPNNNGCDGEMVYEDSKSDYFMISNGKGFSVVVDHEEYLKPDDFIIMNHWGVFDKKSEKLFEGDKILLFDTIHATCFCFSGCFGYVIKGFLDNPKVNFHTFLDNPNFNSRDGIILEVEKIGNIYQS